MMQSVAGLAKRCGIRTGAIMLAAALLCPAARHAQSSGNGLSNLFGNIFSGPKSGSAVAGAAGARPRAGAAALERRGRRLRPSR